MPLIYTSTSTEKTFELGQKLAQKLQEGHSVLLFGELGAGKTHFVQGLAQGLGIQESIKSPTYAYVRQYERPGVVGGESRIRNPSFYHYDLYRLNAGEDPSSIGLEDSLAEDRAIHAIEWADRLVDDFPLPAVHVRLSSQADHHRIVISFKSLKIPSAPQIDAFYKHWATPLHVRRHMAQVARVSMQMAQAYANRGEIVKAEELYAAAILHDLTRVCDFSTLRREDFKEEITGEKWARWVDLRERFKGQIHPQIGRDFLKEKGFFSLADLVYSHGTRVIVQEPECLSTLEAKILYYADKRVKHDEIVDLAERFRDGRERYGEGKDEASRLLFKEIEKKTFELEKELFEGLKIGPEQIS